MDSTSILINNLKNYFKTDSLRNLGKKMNFSNNILLNWSSGRSSPSLQQLNDIAYQIGVEVSQLLVENNSFSIGTPIWRDHINLTLLQNLGKLRLEKDIHESYFNLTGIDEQGLSYQAFLRYLNGKNKRVNLKALDKLSKVFGVSVIELLEREN